MNQNSNNTIHLKGWMAIPFNGGVRSIRFLVLKQTNLEHGAKSLQRFGVTVPAVINSAQQIASRVHLFLGGQTKRTVLSAHFIKEVRHNDT